MHNILLAGFDLKFSLIPLENLQVGFEAVTSLNAYLVVEVGCVLGEPFGEQFRIDQNVQVHYSLLLALRILDRVHVCKKLLKFAIFSVIKR